MAAVYVVAVATSKWWLGPAPGDVEDDLDGKGAALLDDDLQGNDFFFRITTEPPTQEHVAPHLNGAYVSQPLPTHHEDASRRIRRSPPLRASSGAARAPGGPGTSAPRPTAPPT